MKHLHTFTQHINESQFETESTNLPEGVKEIDTEELKKWAKKSTRLLTSGDNAAIEQFNNWTPVAKSEDPRDMLLIKSSSSSEVYQWCFLFKIEGEDEDKARQFLSKTLEGVFETYIITSPSPKVREQLMHYIDHYVHWIKIR